MATTDVLTVAVLGLGEAGAAIASDLARAGLNVRGWDPAVADDFRLTLVELADNELRAVEGADVILSVNSASVCTAVATSVAPILKPEQLFADLNTASPAQKREASRVIEEAGASFADVALMAPVPKLGLRTPCLVSGSGAGRFAELFEPLGVPVTVEDEQPGSAAARKLLRSVFMKGMAATIIESLEAAAAANCSEWMRDEIKHTLKSANEDMFYRLVEGSHRHARRRIQEMSAATELLRDLGVEPRITSATMMLLSQLDDGSRNQT